MGKLGSAVVGAAAGYILADMCKIFFQICWFMLRVFALLIVEIGAIALVF